MNVYLSLARLYIQSFYNLPTGKSPGMKRDRKSIRKAIAFGALMVLVVGDFGYLFVMVNLGMYKGLAMAGMQGILVLNAAIMATMLTLVVGFMTALSTYYLNDMELQLLSMPIQPRALFGAKFTVVYISEALFSLFFMAIAMMVFGIKEGPDPLFYVWGTLAGLLLPFPVLAVSYLIQIPLLSCVGFLKNKQTIMIVGGVVGVAAALGFNVFMQNMMMRIQDPAALANSMASPDSFIARMGSVYPPALFAWRAMSHPASAGAIGSMLAMLVVCLSGPAIVIFFLSGAYAKSLVGFNEAHVRKLTKTGADRFIARHIRSGYLFLTLVKRELAMMNREPMYLLNGPFIIILMPIVVGVMFMVQRNALLNDPGLAELRPFVDGGFGCALAGLVGAFMGSSTSIACTSVSRDARILPFMKSLPLKPAAYMLAKLAHGLIFAFFGSIIGVGLITVVLRLGLVDVLASFPAALSMSILLNIGGLWLDTANPRLDWENPIAAMKQNPNAVIAILGGMGLLGGSGYIAFRASMDSTAFALWFGAVPFVMSLVMLAPYPRFAEKRMARMEG
jgi:ABC-2 type transport system permease protein